MTSVTTTVEVSDDTVRGLLCCAFEGGSNYWLAKCRYEFADGLSYEDFRAGGSQQKHGDYWHPNQLIPLVDGCSVMLKTDGRREEYRLNRESIERGLRLMASAYPKHFSDVLNKNEDANTGDVFLQLCLFGELVYC